MRITGVVLKFTVAGLMTAALIAQGALTTYIIHTPRSPLDGVWRATSVTVDGAPALLTQRDPAPWTNVAITLRGNDDIAALEPLNTAYDSVVTQDPAGYTTVWSLKPKGDVLELRRKASDAPLLVTTRLDGDVLHLSATVDDRRIEGTYERRFMERQRSHFRLVQSGPDGARPDSGSE